MQKLIETLKSPEQVAMVIKALADGVVELIKDLNAMRITRYAGSGRFVTSHSCACQDDEPVRWWSVCFKVISMCE